MATPNSNKIIADFIRSLDAAIKPEYKEWVDTTWECWVTRKNLTPKQLAWLKTTAKFQHKALPPELIDEFPELEEIEVHKRKPAEVEPQPASNSQSEQQQILAEMIGEIADVLSRAAERLNLR